MNSAPPTPHRSVLAVWHWPRWMWCVVVVIGILYPFTWIPVVYVMRRVDVSDETFKFVTDNFFWPSEYLFNEVEFCYDIMSWELVVLQRLFGPL